MKKILKRLLANFGYKISKISKKSDVQNRNKNAFQIQKQLIKKTTNELTIFDVGAYVGGVALKYNELFPKSRIFCFEPFPDSFAILEKKMSSFNNIITINKGLSDYEGQSKFQTNSSPDTNSILKTHPLSGDTWGEGKVETLGTVDIELTTLDSFVEKNAIEKIDILKLDVQGAEYMVLNGAKTTLEKGIVNMIYTEIIMLPTYQGQMHFDETIKLIRSFGYELFNFYNNSLTIEGQLRQVDAIFVKSNQKKQL